MIPSIGTESNRTANGIPVADDSGQGRKFETSREPIAVIGLDVRLPQDASSDQGLWKMIYEGRDATTAVPQDRVNMNSFYHPDPNRTDTVILLPSQ